MNALEYTVTKLNNLSNNGSCIGAGTKCSLKPMSLIRRLKLKRKFWFVYMA